MSFFCFPDDAHSNENADTLEFGVGIGEYEGVVYIPRTVFRLHVEGAVTPEKCVEALSSRTNLVRARGRGEAAPQGTRGGRQYRSR